MKRALLRNRRTASPRGVPPRLPRWTFIPVALLAPLCAAAFASASPSHTQTVLLQPGWNSVYLHVQPQERDPASVFSGVPVESVWTWVPKSSAVEFIQDPREGLWGRPGWLAYRPGLRPELTSLHAVLGNRPYLVKLSGEAPVVWSVTGRPAAAPIRWVADSFNLVGLPVRSDDAVTFADFFAASPAHAARVFYRLGAGGSWEFVDDPGATSVRGGEAYWVYCEGASAFQGPLVVTAPGDGLDYGTMLSQLSFSVSNLTAAAKSVTLAVLPPADADVLVEKVFDETSGFITWPALPRTLTVEGGQTRRVTLGVRRELLGGAGYEAVLLVGEDHGAAVGVGVLLPVSAQ